MLIWQQLAISLINLIVPASPQDPPDVSAVRRRHRRPLQRKERDKAAGGEEAIQVRGLDSVQSI